ncbi:MAG: DUF4838 domain-containing protein [Lentisphaeria bacterium]
MKKLLSIASILLLCATMNALAAVTIVKDGKSDFEIVIKTAAPQLTRFAAEELSCALQKVTGVQLALTEKPSPGKKAIYLGAHSDLKGKNFDPSEYEGTERFRIDEWNGNLVIMGAEEEKNPLSRDYGNFGLLFGVYDFLEKYLGFRWYTPGEFGECFDALTTVTVDQLPIDQTPHYWSRTVWPYFYNEFNQEESMLWNRRMRMFGTGDGGSNHSFQDMYFLYKDSKPEIFALKPDGKSREFGTLRNYAKPEERQWATYPQFCFTNPETIKAYCEMIDRWYANDAEVRKNWITRHPSDTRIYIVPDDNYTSQPCYCPNCQAKIRECAGVHKGTMTNLVWGFTKQVAEYCQEKYPDKKVMALAYEGYYQPPEFELPDNLVVQICVNPYIIYMGQPSYRKNFDLTLQQWSRKVSEISVWHYLLPYDFFPYAMPQLMYDWHRSYPSIRAGFLELNNFGEPGVPLKYYKRGRCTYDLGQTHLNVYFAMKGMWGADLDVPAELERYYRSFYGTAYQEMKEYYHLTIGQWEQVKDPADTPLSAYAKFSGKKLYEEIYSPEVVAKMRELLTQAMQATEKDSIYRQRIEWLHTSFLNRFFTAADAYATEMNASRDLVLIDKNSSEPVIDGNFDDIFWQQLPEHHFVRFDSPVSPRSPTTFRIAVSGGKLFIALHAEDPDCQSQRLNQKSHDSEVFMDDSIELFFVPDASKPDHYKQIMINPLDVICDSENGGGKNYSSARNYESGVQSKTIRKQNSYSMELAFPLAKLGIPADRNTSFAMNICRNKRSGVGENHESSQWHCTFNNGFGYLVGAPEISIIGINETVIDFSDPETPVAQALVPMPNDRPAKVTQKGVSYEITDNSCRINVVMDKENNRYDYATFTFKSLANAQLSKDSCIEIRFRNPDAGFVHTLSYAFTGSDGKIYADYSRFVKNEAFPHWRIRAVRIADGGYTARTKKTFEPAKTYSIQIYSSSKKDGQTRQLEIDYLRITDRPLVEPYIEPK